MAYFSAKELLPLLAPPVIKTNCCFSILYVPPKGYRFPLLFLWRSIANLLVAQMDGCSHSKFFCFSHRQLDKYILDWIHETTNLYKILTSISITRNRKTVRCMIIIALTI